MNRRIIVSLIVLLVLGVSVVAAQDAPTAPPNGWEYQWVEVASGFERPVFVTHANDDSGRLFIEDQYGHIWVMIDGTVQETPFLDVQSIISNDSNEQGLLGLAFHPNYAENGQFFIGYTDVVGNNTVARYTVSADDPNVADPNSGVVLMSIEDPYGNHNGGYVGFGPDGYLYIAFGDGGSAGDPQGNGQNPSALLGKMLRIDVDNPAEGQPYGIPADNPFSVNPEFAPEVWAWGLRNPWRVSFDRATGDFYIADVGQNEWEEVNFQPADSTGGENYGWNILEGTHAYSGASEPEGLVAPFAEYSHSEGGCSVTGGYVYRGANLPGLTGIYLYGDYCSGLIWSSYRDSAGEWQTNLFMETGALITSFGEDEDGELYLVDHGGKILKLEAV